MTTPQCCALQALSPAALADEVKRLVDLVRRPYKAPGVSIHIASLHAAIDRLATLATTAQAAPAAWLHEDGERVITDQQKRRAITDGGASASTVAGYSIALATTAQAAEVAEQVRVPAGWRLVPDEPTEDMVVAMCVNLPPSYPDESDVRNGYREMLAAAPAATERKPLTDERLESAWRGITGD